MVRLLVSATALAVCLLLVTGTAEAEKKKKAAAITGKLTTVTKDSIEVTSKGKKDETPKMHKASGEKGVKASTVATSELTVGQVVTVTPSATSAKAAAKVLIHAGKKKKAG
jgi:hypothetical protein